MPAGLEPMKVAVATDGGEAAEAALRSFAAIADPASVVVTVLSVVPTGPQSLEHVADLFDPREAREQHAERCMKRAVHELLAAGFDAKGLMLTGSPGKEIAKAVRSHGYELIAMGSGSRSHLMHALLGSVSNHVLNEVGSSVLIAHPRAEAPSSIPARIILGTDGGPEAESALAYLARMADRAKAVVKAVSVVPAVPVQVVVAPGAYLPLTDTHERDRLRWEAERAVDRATAYLDRAGFNTSSLVDHGPPGVVLAEVASDWGAEIVVVGTKAQGRLKRAFVGSVAHSVARRAPTTLVVRAPFAISLRSRVEARRILAPSAVK